MTLDIAVAVYNYLINVYLKLFHYFGISYITCSICAMSYWMGNQLVRSQYVYDQYYMSVPLGYIKNKWQLILDF
jgi:hypothetical protein